jgi:hypothetical protein
MLALYPEDSSVCTDRMKLLEAGDGEQYLCAIYWAVQIVTTTGNGDMVPQTDAERTFSLFAMIVGACLFLIFVVTIHSLVADARSHHQCFQDEVNATTAYLRSRNVPQRLLKEMEEHYSYQWRMSKGYDDVACLSRLPLSVQMRAFQLMHGALVSTVDFLTVRPPSDMAFWGMFLEELKTEIVSPNTWIYREGDPADCVYLVKDGLVSSPAQRHLLALCKPLVCSCGHFVADVRRRSLKCALRRCTSSRKRRASCSRRAPQGPGSAKRRSAPRAAAWPAHGPWGTAPC